MRGMMYDVNISNPVWKVVEPLAHEKLIVVMNYLTFKTQRKLTTINFSCANGSTTFQTGFEMLTS